MKQVKIRLLVHLITGLLYSLWTARALIFSLHFVLLETKKITFFDNYTSQCKTNCLQNLLISLTPEMALDFAAVIVALIQKNIATVFLRTRFRFEKLCIMGNAINGTRPFECIKEYLECLFSDFVLRFLKPLGKI